MPDRFETLQAFVAVCDARGFTAAARRMGVSPSAVTRLVAGLENRLGVRLLQRTTRVVKLTDAGARFLERARRILAEVEEAESSAQDERAQPRGRLVAAAPLLFGRMHVAPLVSRFLDLYPRASAELVLSDSLSNLVEDGIDIAIRIGALADSALIARRLGQTRRLLVASPAYLDANGGPPRDPTDLARYRLVAFRAMAPARDWMFRGRDGQALAVGILAHFVTNSGDVAIEHARSGGGITTAFCYQVDAALRSGTLVEVLPAFATPPVPIQALFPSARLLSGTVRAFLNILEEGARRWDFVAGPPGPYAG